MTDLTALTEITAPTTDDLVYVVDAPSGAKNPRKCSIANLVDARTKTLTNTTLNSSTNTVHADATQTYARNSSGSTITKGSPVYISGFDVGTTNPEISLADASVSGTMPCIGLVSADIANNATGTVIASGQLTTLNTSTYSVGDTLYVSETTGTLTATKPTGTALIQNIAIVERVHSSFGVVHISAINRSNDLPNIPDGKLWIGNSSAVPTDVTLSGDVTVTNSGVTAIGAIKVTNAMLAGSIVNTKLTTDPLARANHTGTQAHTTISDFDTGVQANRLDQLAVPTGAVALNSQKITGLANGVASTDAATKGQVDTAVASDITLKGSYNATSNVPNLDNSPTAGTILKGDHYVVATAGTFYSEALQVGDSLIATDDDPVEAEWIITNSQMVTPIVTANIADEAVTEGKIYVSNAGNNGEFLSKQSGNNGGLTWATVPAGYNTPTIGSTTIPSGQTIASLAGLTNLTATGTLTSGQVNILAEGDLRLEDASGNEYVALEAPATVGTSYTVKLPAAIGAAGEALKVTSIAGAVQTMEWGSAGGAVEPLLDAVSLQNSSYVAPTYTSRAINTASEPIQLWVKDIDTNNQGVYMRIKKNGAYTDVQIA